jgi:23S rRNA pseudouridine1911/1915/1917 synthase
MADQRTILVPDGLEGERLDAALARLFGVSRTKAADLARAGEVQLNHRQAGKSDRVSAGDLLEVALPAAPQSPTLETVAEPVPGMNVVHDDDDIVVVDKPVGVAAHPSVGWTGPTVVGGLAAAGYKIATSGASERQGIVSRLDVGTSGLMVVAKSEYAYSRLKQAFRSRSVDKKYHALVQGLPDPVVGTIDAPIGRHPSYDYKFAVMDQGKPSVTHYEVIEAFRAASLVDVHLETGRTHQIRVHLTAIGHPVVSDALYARGYPGQSDLIPRQALHAEAIAFRHPGTGQPLRLTAPLAADFAAALSTLRA